MARQYRLPPELVRVVAGGLSEIYLLYAHSESATDFELVLASSSLKTAVAVLEGINGRPGVKPAALVGCVVDKSRGELIITADQRVATPVVETGRLLFSALPRELNTLLLRYLRVYYILYAETEGAEERTRTILGVFSRLDKALLDYLNRYGIRREHGQLNRYDEEGDTWTLSQDFDYTMLPGEHSIEQVTLDSGSGAERIFHVRIYQDPEVEFRPWKSFRRTMETAFLEQGRQMVQDWRSQNATLATNRRTRKIATENGTLAGHGN